MNGRRSTRSLLAGAAVAACWGAIFEAGALTAAGLRQPLALTTTARLARVAEVAAAATLAGMVVGLLLPVLLRRSSWPREHRPLVIASAGFALILWLTLAFVVRPVPAEAMRLTTDFFRLGLLPMAAAAVVTAAVVIAASRMLARDRHHRRRLMLGRLTTAGAVALLTALLLVPGPGERPAERPDIILLTIDTLRADHLGCYGYELDTSPAMDEFCAEALLYEQAMAPTPSTVPSYTSMLTGVLPDRHRVFSNYDRAGDELETVAEQVSARGYLSLALLDNPLPGTYGNLAQGFEVVVQRGVTVRTPWPCPSETLRSLLAAAISLPVEKLRLDCSLTSRSARRWLRELDRETPLFAHVYWPYPHAPYAPPRKYLEAVAFDQARSQPEVRAYDGEIRFTDAQVGLTLDALTACGRLEGTWVLLTADHGEEMGRPVTLASGTVEPYFGHSLYLFDSSIRVPLCVRPPSSLGSAPRRMPEVVSTAAVAATILDAAGAEPEPGLHPSLPLDAGMGDASFALSVARYQSRPVNRVSIRADQWRLIESRAPVAELTLFHHGQAGEVETPIASRPDVVTDLITRLHAWDQPRAGATSGGKADLSQRERDYLEALGYADLD